MCIRDRSVHRHNRRGRIKRGGPDLRDRAEVRHPFQVRAHIDPVAATVARVPDLAVIGTGPEQAALTRR
mgnify:CR=1 FL=1